MLEREYRTSDFTENLYTHSYKRYQDIMTSFISLYIILSTVCVNVLSAEPEISVSGPVGSTAVLPCELKEVDTETPYIKWDIKFKTQSKTVFEREGEESDQGEGYEGRVDVPVEELRKGNCSLVLRDLRLTDTEIYNSYLVVSNTKSGLSVTKEISRVHLTVHERTDKPSGSSGKSEESTDENLDNGGKNLHYLWFLVLSGVVLLGLVVVWRLKKKKKTNTVL